MKTRIARLRGDVENATNALVEAIEQAYPRGTVVHVTFGGRGFVAEIKTHGYAWSDPERLTGVNSVTGKRRHFYVENIDYVIRYPEGETDE